MLRPVGAPLRGVLDTVCSGKTEGKSGSLHENE
jgi:hypothetical protein